jgi:small-conductance mechanosensitive channel
METGDAAQYELTERRIARFTLIVGGMGCLGAGFLFSIRVAAGVLVGALLAWINFIWLERTMTAVTRAVTARAGSPEARVPVTGYLGIMTRYALIAGVVYVIFSRLRIPVLSMLVGLCALGVATILATVWEVVSPVSRRDP